MLLNCGYCRRLLRVPWSAEIKPVSPKGNQSWIFIRRTDPETETPIFWLPDAKSWLIRKDPDAGKDWMQEEIGATEDQMVGWHHWLNGHEFEKVLGDREGQGRLVCCRPWGRKESDMTKQLSNNNNKAHKWFWCKCSMEHTCETPIEKCSLRPLPL